METMVEETQDIDVTILRCPITKQELVYHSSSLLQSMDGCYAYPIKGGIFLLTAESAIDRTAGQESVSPMREEKKIVRDFYNDFGWKLTESGIYKDTAVWVDQRTPSLEFGTWCARRVGAYLPRSGRYLLDAGSGPIPHPVYMEYHTNYARRICVDFSIEALQEAQQKLGARGIYVLGDVTNLPFRDDAIDAVIANHVVYHVPADEQEKAFRELWRVTRPGGRAVVVYAWKAVLPKLVLRFATSVLRLKKTEDRLEQEKEAHPNLYGFFHTMKWFSRKSWPFKYRIEVFQVVSADFMFYLDDGLRSRLLMVFLKGIQYAFPGWCGRYGAHPVIIIYK